MNKYIHGYSEYESNRLHDQADSLADLLHHDSIWEKNSLILEAACGIGAQTKIIAPKNINSKFISIDISNKSLEQAKNVVDKNGITNVEFQKADIFSLPYEDEHFDHIFFSYLLEHLPNPVDALIKLKRVLKKNGTITVIEGDHGSANFYPYSELAKKAIQCQVLIQKMNGGNANIGRSLFPILNKADFKNVNISPRQVYVDDSNPKWLDGFIKKTFTAMINGVKEDAVSNNLMSRIDFERGIEDLERTAEGKGTFSYTFYKGSGTKG